MSIAGNTALARPLRAPAEPATRTRPHLEVAPSRAQRRARPKLLPALVTIAGIGVILLAQLLLSIALADGAYQIASKQGDLRDLQREQQALAEKVEILSSTQNLTANAEVLGMVASGNPIFLDATTGVITGSGTAAGGSLLTGGNLVGNVLLDGSTVIDPTAIAAALAAEAASPDTGGSTMTGVTPAATPTTPGLLPSPNTH
ncbi:hypothetical protein BH11ACT3_BH11ACT3_17620 [soil metagenome]